MEPRTPLPAHLAEVVANYNAATLPTQLMSKPVLSWDEFWQGLLNLPAHTARQIVRQEHPPKFFLIGRRRFIRTADAVEWLNRAAETSPYIPEPRGSRAPGSH